MTTSDYLAMSIYRDREREMMRDIERRRVAAERVIKDFNDRIPNRGRWAPLRLRLNRLQAQLRHQPVRG